MALLRGHVRTLLALLSFIIMWTVPGYARAKVARAFTRSSVAFLTPSYKGFWGIRTAPKTRLAPGGGSGGSRSRSSGHGHGGSAHRGAEITMDSDIDLTSLTPPDIFSELLSMPPECVAIGRPRARRSITPIQGGVAPPASVSAPANDSLIGVNGMPVTYNTTAGGTATSTREQDDEPYSYIDEVTPFVEMFRDSAPYISMHRGSVMILHLLGDMIGTPVFEKTLDDVALMNLLGVKIVIVCGVANKVDQRLFKNQTSPIYCGDVRITDAETLRIIKEEAGFARCEIESALSRGFKGRPGTMGINVVGGNFFYSAKPYGVIEGIDFGYTGEVRKIDADSIMKRLNQGDVVLLSTIGYSASGQTFNVMSEHLATECASAIQAAKLIFVTGGETLIDTRTNHIIQSLRSLLEYHNIGIFSPSVADACIVNGKPVLTPTRGEECSNTSALMRFTRYSVQALLKGVKRAHLVAPGNGRILEEIFTRDGAGTLISRDLYDGIRPAKVSDVPAIMDIIQPLMDEKVLYLRTNSDLEKHIHTYFVFVRDGHTVACGQLKKIDDSACEVACLAVHPSYRKGGRGDAMLAYLERVAVSSGLTTIFVLSTRTMQWFLERGFEEADVEALPELRRKSYNWQRKSKIYMKNLKTSRDLDAEELFLNI